MTDTLREVEIVSLPLRFAMIANRADLALDRFTRTGTLTGRDRKALENAGELLAQAQEGERFLSTTNLADYSPAAISAFQLTERAGERVALGRDFRTNFQQQIKSLLDQTNNDASDVDTMKTFFHQLSEWCLSQDSSEIERVSLD